MMEQREINTNLEYVSFPLIPTHPSLFCLSFANVLYRYEQLTISAASLREELHTEVEKILNDVIKFKIHVQGRLEEYEEFVSDEVERETEVLQRAEDDLLAEEQQEGDAEVAETMDQSMVDDDERYYD